MKFVLLATLILSQSLMAQSLKPIKKDSVWRQDPKNQGCQLSYVKNIKHVSMLDGLQDNGSPLIGAVIGNAIVPGTVGVITGALAFPLALYGGLYGIESLRDHEKLRALAIIDFADYKLGTKIIPVLHKDSDIKDLIPTPSKEQASRRERRDIRKANRAIKKHNETVLSENADIKEWMEVVAEEFNELRADLKKNYKVDLSEMELATLIAKLNKNSVFCNSYSAKMTFLEKLAQTRNVSVDQLSKKVRRYSQRMGNKASLATDNQLLKYVGRYLTVK